MKTLHTVGVQTAVRFQQALSRIRTSERGDGLVSFLIVAVAVAAIALFVLGVFETEATNKINELDLGAGG